MVPSGTFCGKAESRRVAFRMSLSEVSRDNGDVCSLNLDHLPMKEPSSNRLLGVERYVIDAETKQA